MRRFVSRVVAVAALLLLGGWGTLTEPIDLGPGKEEDLRTLFRDYGLADKDKWLAELTDRGARHPVHQFIVYQAYLLLAQDPAFADNASGFPDVHQINAWDGVERHDGFMLQRPSSSTTTIPGLATPASEDPNRPYGGPSADAERKGTKFTKGWNERYNGRAHYWNPWLNDGLAPEEGAKNYSRLVHSIVEGGGMNERAHFAAYMAHYISDVTSAKHADAFTLDMATVTQLDAIAQKWAKGTDLMDMLADPQLAVAERLLRARVYGISAAVAPAYWKRVDTRIPFTLGSELFNRRSGVSTLVDLPPSSMLTATACYLHGLGTRPPDQPLEQFFTYFDPFYFNGPLVDPTGLMKRADPIWETCVGFSEHLQWESNPTHYQTVLAAMQGSPTIWDPSLKGNHRALKRPPELFSPDPNIAKTAMQTAIADMTKQCSQDAHGRIEEDRDFKLDHTQHMKLAIQCVYTAFRASITALRVEAYGRRRSELHKERPDYLNIKLTLEVKNLAATPAKLHHAKVFARAADGTLTSRPGWTVALGGRSVGAASSTRFHVDVENIPRDISVDSLVVDIHGEVTDTPDSGWRRAKVEDRELKIVKNPDATKSLTEKQGPIDVILVLDTTGSMQSSVDAVPNAIASIRKLREKSKDIRLAVVTFRDLEEKNDRPYFRVIPFSKNVEGMLDYLNSLKVDGGGDTPEDLLHGVSMGLALWEKEGPRPGRVPTKIIIVITDAPAKSPDSRRNTWESIGERAYKVDPAHIYPIIVGSDATALEHAQILADKTGGKVIRAAKGDEVEQAILDAVATAETEHADEEPRGRQSDAWALTGVGIVALLVGAALLVFVAARERHREEATHVGPH